MARNEVIVVCRETSKFSATAIGLDENISMANAKVVDHLTSRVKNSIWMHLLSRINITMRSVG